MDAVLIKGDGVMVEFYFKIRYCRSSSQNHCQFPEGKERTRRAEKFFHFLGSNSVSVRKTDPIALVWASREKRRKRAAKSPSRECGGSWSPVPSDRRKNIRSEY